MNLEVKNEAVDTEFMEQNEDEAIEVAEANKETRMKGFMRKYGKKIAVTAGAFILGAIAGNIIGKKSEHDDSNPLLIEGQDETEDESEE